MKEFGVEDKFFVFISRDDEDDVGEGLREEENADKGTFSEF